MQQAAALLFLAVVAFEPFGYRAAAQRADTSRTVAQQLASFVAANDLLRRVVVDPSVVENDLLTCKFYLVGNVLNSPVDCTSPDLSSRATGIANASINCTGPTVNATFQGGQALAGFTSGFSGITYVKRNDLPDGAILIENMSMRIVDSTFAGVTASGQAPVVLSNSHVFFDNVTFDRNCQSNAGAISVNQTSFATIDNSLFTNNLGFEAGAIAVGDDSTLYMKNSKCDNNTGAQGGCIAANNANNLGFVNVSLDGNHAQNGGGLYALGCTELVVYNATMQRNTAAVNGGGVFQDRCSGEILDTTFTDNIAQQNGAAHWIDFAPYLIVYGNTYTNNTAGMRTGRDGVFCSAIV